MGQLVLLVVAAAWAAVLIPPLLRSRIENRPNSSVTDFRRQLNRLQRTVPSRTGSTLQPVGRQLAPSRTPARAGGPRYAASHRTMTSSEFADHRHGAPARSHRHDGPAHRRSSVHRSHPVNDLRRRRSNVLFLLVATTLSTLFLAATTKSELILYIFAAAFLALCGYIYLLAQIRQREQRAVGGDPWRGIGLR